MSGTARLRPHLGRLRAVIAEVLDPHSSARPDELGTALAGDVVAWGLTSPAGLGAVLDLLNELAGPSLLDRQALHRLQTALVVEHAGRVQGRLLAQQEALHQAALVARTEADARRQVSEARFASLFDSAPVGIGIADMNGRILRVNEALQGLFGYSEAEMTELAVQSFVHPEDAPAIWRLYERLIAGELDGFRTEKRYLHRNGAVIWSELSVWLIRDAGGLPTHQVAVVQDTSERHDLEIRLRHAATHDALTGLPNRRLFLDHLEWAVHTAAEHTRLVLCFFDLDNFKGLNDTWGHLVGDLVLQQVGRRLDAAVRGTGGLLARLGGDEFVVLVTLPADSSADRPVDPEALAGRLLAALTDPVQVPGGQPLPVRGSVGLVELPATQATAERLLEAADLARRAAKQEGKGRVVRHDPNLTASQLVRVGVALSLPGAAERAELDLVYQPMVRLEDGRLHGVEALVRWRHPELGLLLPDTFIPVAEEIGQITSIGEWVLQRACRDLAARGEGGPWPAVNINMSVHQFHRASLVRDVRNTLQRFGIEPNRLRVEVTESSFVDPHDRVSRATMYALADLGVVLVLDDFGTGYSNLAALRRLPLHELKLAGSFVQLDDPRRAPVDRHILDAVVGLAHDLGLTVTVEGVQTAEQDRLVREIGCDVGQGWFYWRG